MTYMRAWMSLKFGQIRLLVSMATDRVNLFILPGSDDIHKSLDEFEIRPEPIRDQRVSCS